MVYPPPSFSDYPPCHEQLQILSETRLKQKFIRSFIQHGYFENSRRSFQEVCEIEFSPKIGYICRVVCVWLFVGLCLEKFQADLSQMTIVSEQSQYTRVIQLLENINQWLWHEPSGFMKQQHVQKLTFICQLAMVRLRQPILVSQAFSDIACMKIGDFAYHDCHLRRTRLCCHLQTVPVCGKSRRLPALHLRALSLCWGYS